MKLTGRTILVTGGGTGIGRSLARQLAEKGNTVLVCGRRLGLLEETARDSSAIHPYRCDLTSSEDVQHMLGAISDDGHRVDTVFSNAAILGFESLAGGLDLDRAKTIIDANLFGPIELTQRMLDGLRKTEDPTIVIVGSPAVVKRPLSEAEIEDLEQAAVSYQKRMRQFRDGLEEFTPPESGS